MGDVLDPDVTGTAENVDNLDTTQTVDNPDVVTDGDTAVDVDTPDIDNADGATDNPDEVPDTDTDTDVDNPDNGETGTDTDNPDGDTDNPDGDEGADNPDEPSDENPDTEDEEDTEEEQPLVNLVVEDGKGKVDSNSYVTLEYADAYHKSFGRTSWEELDEDSRRSRLVIATRYVDATYPWKGTRMYRDQRLAFPRVELYDLDGFPVEGIPENLKMAVCEAAFIAISGNSLFLTRDANGQVKRESVENAVEVEYYQRESGNDFVSVYSVLDSLLKGLFKTAATKQRINTRARWIS